MMMEDYIRKAQAAGASDLHLTSGLAPRYRINGAITDSGDPVLTESNCRIMEQWQLMWLLSYGMNIMVSLIFLMFRL